MQTGRFIDLNDKMHGIGDTVPRVTPAGAVQFCLIFDTFSYEGQDPRTEYDNLKKHRSWKPSLPECIPCSLLEHNH